MKNLVLTPGPVPVPEFVMLEMAKPIIHHRTEEFEEKFWKSKSRRPESQSVRFNRAGYFPVRMLARVGEHTWHAA